MSGNPANAPAIRGADTVAGLDRSLEFLERLFQELEDLSELYAPNAHVRMSLHILRRHFEARVVTPTSAIAASGAPYATAHRRLKELARAGLIETRPRQPGGKSVSAHPSANALRRWQRFDRRLARLIEESFGARGPDDYFFGDSYLAARTIPPPQVLAEPLRLQGGLRVLAHGDPTFMVMGALKRQFEQVLGVDIRQRAFSIDRLREEGLRNAARKISRYDLIAVDLPWIGEFAEKRALTPLDALIDPARLDPADFHTAGWQATHWGGRAYAVPAQTTPELLFYRRDLFEREGIAPPRATDEVLAAAKRFHRPQDGLWGLAWNAARGTALGHTFLMMLADFGQPIVAMPEIAGGYDASALAAAPRRARIDTEAGREAAAFLLELLDVSPPGILSMSWYERMKPYAEGKVALAYGYTLLAPMFEADPNSPANGATGCLPHPCKPGCAPIAPVGGYALGVPANLPEERRAAVADALLAFTSPEAQKLYVLNGSRTNSRYSVSADPEVRATSEIFDAVDLMIGRDELQFWPRPPIPEINAIIQICGEELHDMLRGIAPPGEALAKAQARADALFEKPNRS